MGYDVIHHYNKHLDYFITHLLVKTLKKISLFLLWSALFAVAYTQSPLYTSNQNQYFLHGFAQAGVGFLKEDWLANTHDSTPLFSLLIAFVIHFMGDGRFFYIFYALLMGVYLFSLLKILEIFFEQKINIILSQTKKIEVADHNASLDYAGWAPGTTTATSSLFILGFLFLQHSAGLRFLLSRMLGTNWTYIFEDGVADQRILGPVLQPSSFGVFLALSLVFFLNYRPYLAVLCVVVAASFHPTYLLPAGMLIASYLFILWREGKDFRFLFKLSLAALIGVLPILVVTGSTFLSSMPEIAEQARQILISYRIPHHAQVSWWIDETALIKITFLVAAIFLARGTRLFYLLLIPGLGSFVLTLVQVITGSEMLALLFPWRISVLLIPISVTIIFVTLLRLLMNHLQSWQSHRLWIGLSLAMIWVCVMIGGFRFYLDIQRKQTEPEQALYRFVANNLVSGDTYLIPLKMQDFRLASGAPAYVDFKSIPYRDNEVLEWYRRVLLADNFYKTGTCKDLDGLEEEGITKVVMPINEVVFNCPEMRLLYQDQGYQLFAFDEN
jgi:hypothetical protein